MNNDLISRSAVIDRLKAKVCNDCYVLKSGGKCGGCFIRAALDMIEDAPAVDAEPVRHGRWVQSTKEDEDWGGFFYRYTCTVCGWYCGSNPNGLYVFCPNCGAKMVAEVQNVDQQSGDG